jgi:phenylalanyl-tRNA synthetase beta chain
MRVPLSWLSDHVDIGDTDPRDIANRLTAAGLQVERVENLGAEITGVVVARVLEVEELTGFKKPIRWVRLDDGTSERHVVCGASNFNAGDVVAYARPPAMLPGGFEITARKTYDHVSDGMICSGAELGISDERDGILRLPSDLELGADAVDALGLRDDVLDISINPDRGYALSVRGVAREVATSYGLVLHDPADVEVPATGDPAYPVSIADPSGCDRYAGRLLRGIDPSAPSPAWLQRRLALAGMRPISLIVDVTNHVMLELGQPLHAFDAGKLTGPIVVRRAAEGEKLRTLDDVDRVLDPSDLLITDDSGPIALAGVMGGASTEISATTTEVVIESAHFDHVSVAITARRHRLGSEASRRFERGVDDALAPAAAEVAVRMLVQLGGADPDAPSFDVDVRRERPAITLVTDLPGRLAGVEYPAETVERRLRDVGCVVTDGATGTLTVQPPSWRPDLRIPVDLVEEVVRLEGYAELPARLPSAPAGHGLTRIQRLRRQVGRTLADAGYAEVLSSVFVDAGSAQRLLLDDDDPRVPSVRVANPVDNTEPFLRTTLLPGLFAALARNVGRGLVDVSLFETGAVFRRRPDATPPPRLPAGIRPSDDDLAALDASLPDQPNRVAAVLTGMRERPGWWGPGRAAAWSDAIEAVRLLARSLGVEITVSADRHPPFHPGRCAVIRIGDTVLGHAGELHPRVVAASQLPPRSCAMELSLDVLLDAAPELAAATPVSAYPAATVDVALVVALSVPAASVEAALRRGGGELVESVRLFDVYQGTQVPAGHRSLAFTLRLRAQDRTLSSEDVLAIRDAAIAEAVESLGAVLR